MSIEQRAVRAHITGVSFIGMALAVSLVLHVAGLGGLSFLGTNPKPTRAVPVKVAVVEKTEVPEEVVPPKPEPKPKKKEPPKTPPTQAPLKKEPESKPVEAIQGINPDAMVTEGKGMAAPVGNTLLKEDEGKRLKPDEVGKLTQDCSADAKLLKNSVTPPQYTEAALDANLEGTFIVDVYVDALGGVVEAELRKKVGYGMDPRIIDAVKKSKFEPRKNKVCGAIPGWAEIKFSLVIP